MPRIAILGATGSIGRQALEVIAHLDNTRVGDQHWQVHSLAADNSVEELSQLARRHQVETVACGESRAGELSALLNDSGVEVLTGIEGLVHLATDPDADIVLIAVYGLAAIEPLMAAAKAGKRIALASKEALVAAGRFVMSAARESGATILPVDSEHSALFQLLQVEGAGPSPRPDGGGQGRPPSIQIRRVTLTASGGPFFGMTRSELQDVTWEQAQHHPTWAMGAGITLNSATLFNKGLELIEAHHLFGLRPNQIDVLIEPTSRVHALVELMDGTTLLHCGEPDMRVPIQYALTWPDRVPALGSLLELAGEKLEFHVPNGTAFPALNACRTALDGPWWLPAALIAANEQLSEKFEAGEIGFLEIGDKLDELANDPAYLALANLPEDLHQLPRARSAVRAWLNGSR